MKVSVNKVISIHYSVTNDDGTVVDSNIEYEPLLYLHGAGNILPALEHQLEGAAEYESRNITLMPDEAYGYYSKELIVAIDKNVDCGIPANPEPGMILTLADKKEVEVVEVFSDKVVVDSNHPLAGKQLHFNITVVSIRAATGKELLSGRPLQEGEFCGTDCSCHD